jgi:uncharacterized protein (DUF4415 family)
VKKPATLKKSRTDWDRVDSLKDEEIDLSDSPEVTPEMFTRAIVRRGLKPVPGKVELTLHLDRDIVEWLQQQGQDYDTQINALVREHMKSQEG